MPQTPIIVQTTNTAAESTLLQNAALHASDESMYWNSLGNQKHGEVSKQLLAVAALLIPILGSAVFADISLNEFQKSTLTAILSLLFISIICGFIDLYVSAEFFNEYAKFNSSRAITYHKKLMGAKTLMDAELSISSFKHPPLRSNDMFTNLQVAALGLSIFMLLGIIFSELYF